MARSIECHTRTTRRQRFSHADAKETLREALDRLVSAEDTFEIKIDAASTVETKDALVEALRFGAANHDTGDMVAMLTNASTCHAYSVYFAKYDKAHDFAESSDVSVMHHTFERTVDGVWADMTYFAEWFWRTYGQGTPSLFSIRFASVDWHATCASILQRRPEWAKVKAFSTLLRRLVPGDYLSPNLRDSKILQTCVAGMTLPPIQHYMQDQLGLVDAEDPEAIVRWLLEAYHNKDSLPCIDEARANRGDPHQIGCTGFMKSLGIIGTTAWHAGQTCVRSSTTKPYYVTADPCSIIRKLIEAFKGIADDSDNDYVSMQEATIKLLLDGLAGCGRGTAIGASIANKLVHQWDPCGLMVHESVLIDAAAKDTDPTAGLNAFPQHMPIYVLGLALKVPCPLLATMYGLVEKVCDTSEYIVANIDGLGTRLDNYIRTWGFPPTPANLVKMFKSNTERLSKTPPNPRPGWNTDCEKRPRKAAMVEIPQSTAESEAAPVPARSTCDSVAHTLQQMWALQDDVQHGLAEEDTIRKRYMSLDISLRAFDICDGCGLSRPEKADAQHLRESWARRRRCWACGKGSGDGFGASCGGTSRTAAFHSLRNRVVNELTEALAFFKAKDVTYHYWKTIKQERDCALNYLPVRDKGKTKGKQRRVIKRKRQADKPFNATAFRRQMARTGDILRAHGLAEYDATFHKVDEVLRRLGA